MAPSCKIPIDIAAQKLDAHIAVRPPAANIFAVDRIAADWECPEALYARMFGAWVVDREFIESKGTKGSRVVFKCIVAGQMRLYVTESFSKAWPTHATNLFEAHFSCQRMGEHDGYLCQQLYVL